MEPYQTQGFLSRLLTAAQKDYTYPPKQALKLLKEVRALQTQTSVTKQTQAEFDEKHQLAMGLLMDVKINTPKGYAYLKSRLFKGKAQLLENGRSLSIIIDVDPESKGT